MLGWRSPEQVRDWMQKSDLYLLASVSEAFNNSVLQAQACGLLVVCSDEGGLPEHIADGEPGLLFLRRDAWDLAEKIEVLLSDPERLAYMRESARRRAELFSMQVGVQRFVSLYQELTG